MTIDPKTLPDGTVAHISDGDGVLDISLVSLWDGGTRYSYRAEGLGGWSVQGNTITRVFVPVPEGMTYADAEAALADAGAWVEVADHQQLPEGARVREERRWMFGMQDARRYVHRDDLPTDPDAELVEKMARGVRAAKGYEDPWSDVDEDLRENYRVSARAALAVVREHEATQ